MKVYETVYALQLLLQQFVPLDAIVLRCTHWQTKMSCLQFGNSRKKRFPHEAPMLITNQFQLLNLHASHLLHDKTQTVDK